MEQGPSQYCDLVMKGGITSGVIYPAAAYELSQTYSFKNIGGTSAGAIAAAVVAAAELGRRSGSLNQGAQKTGFDVVKDLSGDITRNGQLLKLFTPDKNTSAIFDVALNTLKHKSIVGKFFAATTGILFAAFFLSLICFCVGLALPTILFALTKWHTLSVCGPLIRSHKLVCLLAGVPLGLIFALIAAVISGAIRTVKAFASNSFGMCSGMARASQKDASLTEWIHQQIQAAAGRNANVNPVTFGDLWNAEAYQGETLKTDKTINLEVVTTSLTEGRPYSIPFQDGALYFDPDELNKLFPPVIINAIIAASTLAKQKEDQLPADNRPKQPERPVSSPTDANKHLIRLPDSSELPILVATRMSLSFPGLLSAIPFYRVDYTIPRNQDQSASEYATRVGTKIWFSDGGICSNFPINFFDSPIPRWPTFGINLTSAPITQCETTPRPPAKFVSMLPPAAPARLVWNNLGDAAWTPNGVVEQRNPIDCIARFAHSIMNTMQNWRDNLQAIAPGYRDRIVTVELCRDEGGLNLNMPDTLIQTLTDRGSAAGKLLNGFDFSQHIFTRFRVALCALDEYLFTMDSGYRNPVAQDQEGWEYIDGKKKPPHYAWTNDNLRDDAARSLNEIHELLDQWQRDTNPEHRRFCRGVPRPRNVLQARPDF
jgi:predicted acylesterase/phospholipase RssA